MILDHLPASVRIIEVGPRDGMQNEREHVPLETKVAFVDALSDAGCPEIEVTSFVSRRRVPQLADGEEVMRRIRRRPGTLYSALVPNEQGLDRALTCVLHRIAVFTAASETFNRRNVRASIAESIERFRPVVTRARDAGLSIRGYVSTAFVCPYEGPIAPERVGEVVDRLLDCGVDEISIGDTIGAAVPSQVDRLLDVLERLLPAARIALHLHDTRGSALANVLVGLQRGVARFDTSAGGLGGCPFAPGATGNLATEDLLAMAGGMGLQHGIDEARLDLASDLIEAALRRPLPSRVRRARIASARQSG